MTDKRGVKSVRFNEELWWQMKEHCVKTRTKISDYLEALVKKDLK